MSKAPAPRRSRLARFRDRVVTADAVYGTILFAALIAVKADSENAADGVPGDNPLPGVHVNIDTTHTDYLQVLLVSVPSLLVFWAAHVYARTIAGHGLRNGEDVTLGEAFRHGIRQSTGMLYSALPAVIVLVLGAVGLVQDAADWALWVNVLVLGVLGYEALAERRRGIPIRILGGLLTALLGFLLIVIDVAVH